MIRTRLETPRLRLRLFTHDDLQVMFELGTDPEVIRYAEPGPVSILPVMTSKSENWLP